jgi:hypothetical protein
VSNSAGESLIETVRRSREQARDTASTAIVALAGVAERLEMPETSARLRKVDANLRSDTFHLIVMGRFKNGKSTLLNAMMGGTTKPVALDGQKGPMVVDDLPATATLTAVSYAEEPFIKMWGFDGRSEDWSLARYLRDSTLGSDSLEDERRFGHIRQFEMGFPARLCQAGVTVYDSPGLDEHPRRDAVTREATNRCDAAIVVYRSDALMGQNELQDAARLEVDTRVFTVVNLWGDRTVDDKLRGFVWNKYIRDRTDGPTWADQDLAERDIFFVNAGLARDARYEGDEGGVERSGLAAFERRLGEFLVRDRQHAHLSKFTRQAFNLGDTIDQHIAQRRLAGRADQERLRRAYAEALPKLEQIRSRPAALAKIFARFREEATTMLAASFLQTVARIRRELPGHLEATPLPSAEKLTDRVTGVFRQKQLQHEAAAIVSAFVARRLDDWGQREATALMAPLMERLGVEVEREIASIGRQLDEIHLDLTGWRVDPAAGGSLVGTAERLVSAVAGLLLGDVSAAVTGGAGGWRGAAGGITGALGMGLILGAIGVTAGIVLFPLTLGAALGAGVLAGGAGLEKRVKEKVAQECDAEIAKLAEAVRPRLEEKLSGDFVQLERTVTDEITAEIDEEARNIRKVVELNQRDQADRERVLAELEDLGSEVAGHRLALQQALLVARQV